MPSTVFIKRLGDGHTVEIPNNLEGMDLTVETPYSHPLLFISGIYAEDGRVGTTTYEVEIVRYTRDADGREAVDGDIVHVEPYGGKQGVYVVALTEVSA